MFVSQERCPISTTVQGLNRICLFKNQFSITLFIQLSVKTRRQFQPSRWRCPSITQHYEIYRILVQT